LEITKETKIEIIILDWLKLTIFGHLCVKVQQKPAISSLTTLSAVDKLSEDSEITKQVSVSSSTILLYNTMDFSDLIYIPII